MFQSRTVTAINIVKTNPDMKILGFSDGSVETTNSPNRPIYTEPENSAVTAIATKAISFYKTLLIIGFANSHLCVFTIIGHYFDVHLESTKLLSRWGYQVMAIGIKANSVNSTKFTIIAALQSYQIQTLAYNTASNNIGAVESSTVLKSTDLDICCSDEADTIAILTETEPSMFIYIYVLTVFHKLLLFRYPSEDTAPEVVTVANNVTKIATPASNAKSLLFICGYRGKIYSEIYLSIPSVSTSPQLITVLKGNNFLDDTTTLMTLHNAKLYSPTQGGGGAVNINHLKITLPAVDAK